MGWEAFERVAPRPRSAVTLGAHRFGKKNQRIMLVLSVPSHVQPWGLAEFCSIMTGNGEDAGKLAFTGNSEGAYKIKQGKTQVSLRFVVPDSLCSEHTAQVVPHTIIAKDTLAIDLPAWALEAVRKPLEPAPEEEPQDAKDVAELATAIIASNEPVLVRERGEVAPIEVNLPSGTDVNGVPGPQPNLPDDQPKKRLARLPSTAEKPIANTKAKDWKPDPAIERAIPERPNAPNRSHAATMAGINRRTEEARRLPESKLSQTEIAPAWRKEPGKPEMLVARTDKADIALSGGYLMLGSTPVSVPKHLRAAIALLVTRFGEPVQIRDISLVSDKAVAVKDLTGLITGKFALLVDGNQLMLTER